MRRTVSSRLLYPDDAAVPDLENPLDQPLPRLQTRRMLRFPPVTVPRPSLHTLTTWRSRSGFIPSVKGHSVLFYLCGLLLCTQTYFFPHTLNHALAGVAIPCLTFLLFIVFKNTSRTDLGSFRIRDHSIFVNTIEPSFPLISRINSLAVEAHNNGIVYAGELKEGYRTGRGVMKRPQRWTYGGDWIRGSSDGYGVEELVDVGLYKGQFLGGVRTGYGYMRYSNGDEYMGQWLNGERQGTGKQVNADGSFYEGQFFEGKKHGNGEFHYSNGNIYQGQFHNEERTGVGIIVFPFGTRYEGSWLGDKPEGYGVYCRGDPIVSGRWVNGDFSHLMPMSDPCIQRTVQAAREAAQNYRKLNEIEDHILQAIKYAKAADKGAHIIATAAHILNKLHLHHLIRLAAMASAEINRSFQALRRTLGNFGRSAVNLARSMVDEY